VAGNKYNINDGIHAKFWERLYEVSKLSGVNEQQLGKYSLVPIFNILFNIAWLFWYFGYPLGNFTPYILRLVTTTHTYSIDLAKQDLGYKPIEDIHISLNKTKESFKNWAIQNPPKKIYQLSTWLKFIALLDLFGSVQAFYSVHTLKSYQFSNLPNQVSPLASHIFGVWTLVAALVRMKCSMNVFDVNIYSLTLQTFIVALLFYLSECFIYQTIPFLYVLPVLIIVCISIIWMVFFRPTPHK